MIYRCIQYTFTGGIALHWRHVQGPCHVFLSSLTGVEWGLHFPSANGEYQSPINLNSREAQYDPSLLDVGLSPNYVVCRDCEVINDGHTARILLKSKSGNPGDDGSRLTALYRQRQITLICLPLPVCSVTHNALGFLCCCQWLPAVRCRAITSTSFTRFVSTGARRTREDQSTRSTSRPSLWR